MKVTYENGWEHTDIHIDLKLPYREDYQIRMLSANDIAGLIKVKGSGRDGDSRYSYRINGGISMEKQYSVCEMKRKDVERFIEDLLGTVEDVVGHLLDPDGIILTPDMVFIEGGKHRFCYLPVSRESMEKRPSLCRSFHQMTEYFVKKLDYRDTKGIFLVYRLHKDTMQEGFKLRKIIEECRRRAKIFANDAAANRIARQGKAFVPVELRDGTTPFYTLTHEGRHYAAIFNFSEDMAELSFDAGKGGLPQKGCFVDIHGGSETPYDGRISVTLSGRDAVILEVIPD